MIDFFKKILLRWLSGENLTLIQRVAYHLFCWFLYVSFFLWWQGVTSHTFAFVLSNEIVKLLFLASAVYFNTLYLIPTYLSEKKFINFLFLSALTAVLITPLEVFCLFIKLNGAPDYQAQVIDNQLSLYVFNIFIVLASTLLKIIADWIRHQRTRQELERQKLKSELDFLRTQINPHFLFNTLNSLYALTLRKSDNAPEIVVKLSEMMRYMLYESNEVRVPLSKEVQYLQHYVDLELLRFGKTAAINFKVEGEVTNQVIAPLLFQTFLENAFKHGLSNAIDNAFVDFQLIVSDNILYLDLKNSKPPTLPTATTTGGIGLTNVRRRLELLYKDQYELTIKDEKNTYNVLLTIEL